MSNPLTSPEPTNAARKNAAKGTASPPAQEGAASRDLAGVLPLTGPQKGFLLLISLEESVATTLISRLGPDELRRLREVAESLGDVNVPTLAALYREFASAARQGLPPSLKGSSAYLRRIAGKALGEGKVADVWSDRRRPEGAVSALSTLELSTIVALLEPEQEQTLAVVLAHFEPERAADVLAKMPSERQTEIIRRMMKLDHVPTAVVREIEEQFAVEIDALSTGEKRSIAGLEIAASIIKRLPEASSTSIIGQLGEADTDAAGKLKKALFTFEELLRIDGRGMQTFLQEVGTPQLVLALKTASADLREKIFASVSSRAAATLRDEIAMLGPTRLSDVEAAQQALVEAALALEQEGRIQIAREGAGNYV